MAILNSLNFHNFPIFPPILMVLVSKFMVHRALSDKTYSSLGLLSPLSKPLYSTGSAQTGSTSPWHKNADVNTNYSTRKLLPYFKLQLYGIYGICTTSSF